MTFIPSRLLLFLLSVSTVTSAQDLLSQNLASWYTSSTRRYARIYETTAAETAAESVTIWNRGQGVQTSPTYVGIHEISYTEDAIYLRSTGLGSHVMGPWYLNEAKTNLFPNFPANQSLIYRLPRNLERAPTNKSLTGLGRIGLFVDGVSMFDSRDAFSYDSSMGVDETPNNNAQGDSIWNRDAFVNESVTFDAANAHQAQSNYHYHANPPALRHQLGDSVDYDPATNRYTENFNGLHSPILAWVSDGHPLYGPYGYQDATDSGSNVVLMRSGFRRRAITQRQTLPAYAARTQNLPEQLSPDQYGPPVSEEFILGHYLEDYEYRGDTGEILGSDFDLDEHNGRFCITPEFPNGVYAYFVSIEADGTPKFPYNIGRTFYGSPRGGPATEVPAEATIIFEGGPEAPLTTQITHQNDEVTLRWSTIEGGVYLSQSSENLTSWETIRTSQSDTSLTFSEPTEQRKFYRSELLEIAPYDSEGFDLAAVPTPQQNNILLIIVDDWGTDSSPLDNPLTTNHASMPNLANMAEQGLRFTNAYAQPTCSPTRAGIITGRYSFRHGIGSPGGANLPEAEFTLPEAFIAANSPYRLASIGKWHLGGGDDGPRTLGGWDEFRGTLTSGVESYTNWTKTINGVSTPNTSTFTTTDQVNDALAFIENAEDAPWLCWLAFNAPHGPFDEAPSSLILSGSQGGGTRGNYERLLESMDTEIGRLLANIDLNETNILLIGDNGTPGNVAQTPVLGQRAKGTLYEGGIKVPFIALGPDIRARGTCNDPVQCTDLYTTILDLAAINPHTVIPEGISLDSRSLFGVLNGSGSVNGGVVLENFGNVDDPGRAIRQGNYKLIIYQDGREELYQLSEDPLENRELISAGLTPADQLAYDALIARHEELSPDTSTTATGITSVSPDRGMAGEMIRLTFNLDPTAEPSVPGTDRDLLSITIGGVAGSSLSRPSRYVAEADFLLSNFPGTVTAEIIFTGPQRRTYGLNEAFTIEN